MNKWNAGQRDQAEREEKDQLKLKEELASGSFKRTERASVKCPTPAEERFRVKLLEQFSVVALAQLVKQVDCKVPSVEVCSASSVCHVSAR